jgi:hypothetical protein
MKHVLTSWDRVVYGVIAALFGSLLGLGAALCLFFVFYDGLSFPWMVLVSAVYFFVIGAIRGPDAGFIVGEAFSAITGVAAAEAGFAANTAPSANSQQSSTWKSPVLLALWVLIMLFVAWKA